VLCAYPPTKELFVRGDLLLKNFYLLTCQFLKANKKGAEQLVNSGLSGTEVHGAFTYPLLSALLVENSPCLYLHSFADDSAPAGEILKHFLPQGEFETLNAEYDNEELITELFGKDEQLQKILIAMQGGTMRPELRDQLFDNLKIFAGIFLDGSIPDRSTARGPAQPVFAHKEIQKKTDPLAIVTKKLRRHVTLTAEQVQALITNSMCVLATLNRETDPVTSCDANGVTLFHLERGVSVALFSMSAERRMPFESYIGYVLFKNGIPLAYGGSWIFGNRALFGINIFEPFRGGESSLTILQLLRVYHKYYGVTAFSVEPYQFGKDNPEGIASGAYWFYYKMGFRSDDKKLAALAENEFAKMQKSKSYRSSVATLKRFTGSRITWKIKNDEIIFPDPCVLSSKITTMIRDKFSGIRQEAIRSGREKFRVENDPGIDEYVLLYLSTSSAMTKISGESSGTPEGTKAAEKIAKLARLKQEDERKFNAFLLSIRSDFQ